MLRNAANYLLSKMPGDRRTVGPNWVFHFLARNPDLYKRKQKPLAVEQSNAEDPVALEEYFEKYQVAREDYGIVDDDVWNMDETGFHIGCGREHWVITLHAESQLRIDDSDNRTYISDAECISAGGVVIPPMLIFPGVQILHKWGLENDMDNDALLSVSDSGYSNDELALGWLKHFEVHSKIHQVSAWRLLIVDSYGSHLTLEFLDYATDYNIILFRLPAHTTHITQPLDVGCFQPLKHYHSEAADSAIQLGDSEFGKMDFLSAFQQVRDQAFKKTTIINAFKHTGLVPFNPAVVIDKVKEKRAARPKTPPQPITTVFAQTPRTTEEVISHGELLQISIDQAGLHPAFLKHVHHFLKGAIAISHAHNISVEELHRAKSAAIKKAAQKKMKGTVAQKCGIISFGDVRAMQVKRVEDEEEKARRVISNAEDKRAREAAKAAERVAIDARKAERLAKKIEKDAAKAERLARTQYLIS